MDSIIFLCVLIVLAGTQHQTSAAKDDKRHFIYWDSYVTPMLKNPKHTYKVSLGSFMDIICPLTSIGPPGGSSAPPLFDLYNVTEEGFNNCDSMDRKSLFSCVLPDQENKLTIKFQQISPSPYGFRFQECADYYLIAIRRTDSTLDGSTEKQKGCTAESEKLRIHVRCLNEEDENALAPTPETTTTTTTTTPKTKKTWIDRVVEDKDRRVEEGEFHPRPVVPDIVPVTPEDDKSKNLAVAAPSHASDPADNGATFGAEWNSYMTSLLVSLTLIWYSIVNSSS